MRAIRMVLLLGALGFVMTLSGASAQTVKIEKIPYFNQPNCYKLSNGTVDVIVTTDIGPRVIAYQFEGGPNMFNELGPDTITKTALGDWHPWGGHRLWHAPEGMPRSYSPDNSPIDYKIEGNSIRLTEKTEPATGIQKEILVTLAPSGTEVTLTHKLTNKGLWAIDTAAWAMTIVRPGGEEFIPNEPFISHDDKLVPARPLVLWNYTGLSDPRITFGKKFTRFRPETDKKDPNKIGVLNTLGWTAYAVAGNVFVKSYPCVVGATYPDMGCNYETYTAGDFLEMESLGPMTHLQPGASLTYIEHWNLFKNVTLRGDDEAVEKTLQPLIKEISK